MRKRIRSIMAPVMLAATIATAALAKDVSVERSGKGYDFSFSYPEIVNGFPALKKQLDSERQASQVEIEAIAKDWLKTGDSRASEMKLESETHWAQVANLPGYLSLTSDIYAYTGGAHGNHGRTSMVWDKKAAKPVDPVDMFTSKAAFDAQVQTPFCDRLDMQRSERRDGEKVDRSQADDWMQACPAPSDYTVIIGSSDRVKFNRMAIYVGPYGAGPYSEGDYEIDMPVTAELIAIVKPAYRAAFAVTPTKKR